MLGEPLIRVHVTEEQTHWILLNVMYFIGIVTLTGGMVLFLQRTWSTF